MKFKKDNLVTVTDQIHVNMVNKNTKFSFFIKFNHFGIIFLSILYSFIYLYLHNSKLMQQMFERHSNHTQTVFYTP